MSSARLAAASLFVFPLLAPAQGPGGPGGGRGPSAETTKVVAQFDKDGNGRLDRAERAPAKTWIAENRPQRGPRRGPPGGFGGPDAPGGPGEPGGDAPRDENVIGQMVRPGDVPTYADHPMFDPSIVRTFFLDFPISEDDPTLDPDWFAELAAFYRTDVQVPVRVTVDGTTYDNVGTSFRGNTSYMMVRGKKKSFDLEFDFITPDQNVGGVHSIDLVNCNGDPSYMREALHGWIGNQFLPTPRVVLARVVCNGEDFGIYAAVQQFDKDFLKDHYGTGKGDRFKVPPDFSGNGGLRYLGDDPTAYERNYQLKSSANPQAWAGLVDLCAVLQDTPTEDLERVLPQHLDIDAALWFLAIDNALDDDDGYHSRASDYSLYRDPKGRFHPIARDNNEVLRAPREGRQGAGGPGAPGGRGPGGRGGRGGDTSSPLAMADREDRPLLHRLLEVPIWRARYLANLRAVASYTFQPHVVGQMIEHWRDQIAPIVERDVHSQQDYRAFSRAIATDSRGAPSDGSIQAVIEKRRQAILEDAAMAGDWPKLSEITPRPSQSPDGKLALHIRCRAAGAELAAVRVHHDRGAFGAYDITALHDDGRHGDEAAGDGIYGGWLPAAQTKDTWRYWIEAVAAESGHVDCYPKGGGALPLRWTAPDKIR